MQITVEIPDTFAASLEARGQSPRMYLEGLIQRDAKHVGGSKTVDIAQFFAEMNDIFKDAPPLPHERFDRESLYQDHG